MDVSGEKYGIPFIVRGRLNQIVVNGEGPKAERAATPAHRTFVRTGSLDLEVRIK